MSLLNMLAIHLTTRVPTRGVEPAITNIAHRHFAPNSLRRMVSVAWRTTVIKRLTTSTLLPRPPATVQFNILQASFSQSDRRNFCKSSPSNSKGQRSTRGNVHPNRPLNEYTLHVRVRLRPRQSSSIISIQRRENESIADTEIAVGARPVDGRANEELVEFLGEVRRGLHVVNLISVSSPVHNLFRKVAQVPKSDIQIVKGTTSKQKVVHLKSCHGDPFERMIAARSQT